MVLLRSIAAGLSGAAVLALGGCGLPADGPRGEVVERAATAKVQVGRSDKLPYCVVPVTPTTLPYAKQSQPRFAGRFDDQRGPTSLRIGIGDVISVTLYESGAGGLFFPLEGGIRQGNYITLPNQEVDNEGNITVPYAGPIKARGRTVSEVQNEIIGALKSRALDPQAVVTVVEQRAALISVLGEVGTPTRFRSNAAGERMLDAISRAGGPRVPGPEAWVLLERNNKIEIAPFEALIREPGNNIYVRPHDTIYLYKQPQTFLAFGAHQRQGQFPFEQWRLSMAEAMAKAGGLNDAKAEPSWVYLYRAERRELVEKLDPKCAVGDRKIIPIVYQVDMRDPAGFFLTTEFPIRDKDVLYVANSSTVEQEKFFNYVQQMSLAVEEPMIAGITFYGLKSAIHGTGSSSVIATTTTPVSTPVPTVP